MLFDNSTTNERPVNKRYELYGPGREEATKKKGFCLIVHDKNRFAGDPGLQETRKILIWEFPVPPAGRSDGTNSIKGGIFASPELS